MKTFLMSLVAAKVSSLVSAPVRAAVSNPAEFFHLQTIWSLDNTAAPLGSKPKQLEFDRGS